MVGQACVWDKRVCETSVCVRQACLGTSVCVRQACVWDKHRAAFTDTFTTSPTVAAAPIHMPCAVGVQPGASLGDARPRLRRQRATAALRRDRLNPLYTLSVTAAGPSVLGMAHDSVPRCRLSNPTAHSVVYSSWLDCICPTRTFAL